MIEVIRDKVQEFFDRPNLRLLRYHEFTVSRYLEDYPYQSFEIVNLALAVATGLAQRHESCELICLHTANKYSQLPEYALEGQFRILYDKALHQNGHPVSVANNDDLKLLATIAYVQESKNQLENNDLFSNGFTKSQD